jgi:hypothetical protein
LTSEASLKYFDEEFYNNGKPKGIQWHRYFSR